MVSTGESETADSIQRKNVCEKPPPVLSLAAHHQVCGVRKLKLARRQGAPPVAGEQVGMRNFEPRFLLRRYFSNLCTRRDANESGDDPGCQKDCPDQPGAAPEFAKN